jgi:hypothetical protein
MQGRTVRREAAAGLAKPLEIRACLRPCAPPPGGPHGGFATPGAPAPPPVTWPT